MASTTKTGPIIAIDGPAGSGKGTLARNLGQRLGLPVLDTGALYRMVAYQALRDGVLLFDEAALAKLAEHPDLSLLNGQELRSVAVAKYTPEVAKFAGVRRALLQFQRDFAHQPGGAILDGRDIGTVVCPDADVKLFVSASLDARAERRSKELRANGEKVNISRIKRDLADRDERDMNRADSPLRPSPDAHQLDTTNLSIEASVEAACRIVNAATARPPA